MKVTPIATADDGTQIWKITHNGVDTHPIHFHAFDVQVLNRVTWDNIIIPPDATELGWKDTVRISPLEDTIVALRAGDPDAAVRPPEQRPAAQPDDAGRCDDGQRDGGADALGLGMTSFDPTGEPIDIITTSSTSARSTSTTATS